MLLGRHLAMYSTCALLTHTALTSSNPMHPHLVCRGGCLGFAQVICNGRPVAIRLGRVEFCGGQHQSRQCCLSAVCSLLLGGTLTRIPPALRCQLQMWLGGHLQSGVEFRRRAVPKQVILRAVVCLIANRKHAIN